MTRAYNQTKVYIRLTLAERFWSKVSKEGPVARPGMSRCWDWTGARIAVDRPYGYIGRTHASSRGPEIKQKYAHIASWELHHGPIPDGMCVCHKCDRPQCVNPDHLFLGTRAENNRDRNTKNRDGYFAGEKNPNAKLTADQVGQIRAIYAAHACSQTKLAAQFGISQGQVSRIVRGTSFTGTRLSRKEQRLLG